MLIRGQVPIADGEVILAQLNALMPSVASYQAMGEVPNKAARRLSCDAHVTPVVLGGASEVLDVGRTHRFFTKPIRIALVLRDRGCVFPGCDAPPSACEGHHIRPWWVGGETSIANGVLVCSYHHRLVEPDPVKSVDAQWGIQIDPVSGVPWFIPPRHIDPERVPRPHHRFLIRGISPPTPARVSECATPAALVPSPAWHG